MKNYILFHLTTSASTNSQNLMSKRRILKHSVLDGILYILYLPFILYKHPLFQRFHLNNGWLRFIAAWAVPVTNFKENFFFDLANPIENYSVFFNLSRVMTLSLEKDK